HARHRRHLQHVARLAVLDEDRFAALVVAGDDAADAVDHQPLPDVSRIAPEGWTSPFQPGGTSVVASSWEMMTGPSKRVPAPNAARSNSGTSAVPAAKCTGRRALALGAEAAASWGRGGGGMRPVASTLSVTNSIAASSVKP